MYIIDHNLDDQCYYQFFKTYTLSSMGEALLRLGRLTEAEALLSKSISLSEKSAGSSSTFEPKVFRIETKIKLNKLQEAYEDCLDIFKLKNIPANNVFNLLYITTFYHAAVIKYKQGDFNKSAEHFSDFFKQIKDFCKRFLEKHKYKDLESKRVFDDINLTKPSSKSNIIQYLKRSTQIFSTMGLLTYRCCLSE